MEENILDANFAIRQKLSGDLSESLQSKSEVEQKSKTDFSSEISDVISKKSTEIEQPRGSNLKSIHLTGEKFVIKDESPMRSYEAFKLIDSPELPGVYFQGIQYYDLKNVYFINNTGMANLIDLLKSLLQKDVEVMFVNVCEKIKNKIKALGLDDIIICN